MANRKCKPKSHHICVESYLLGGLLLTYIYIYIYIHTHTHTHKVNVGGDVGELLDLCTVGENVKWGNGYRKHYGGI